MMKYSHRHIALYNSPRRLLSPARQFVLCVFMICLIGLCPDLSAQSDTSGLSAGSVTLRGGTLHLGNGKTLENGHILFETGRIRYVGTESQEADRIIDVSGQHVYPGLIAVNTNLGLTEIDAVRATLDYREVGNYNPHVRALVAYNTDSEIIPVTRSNGILLAEVAPQGGIISGQSAVFRLDGWNWEDAVVKDTAAIHLYWPAVYSFDRGQGRTARNKNYEKEVKELEEYFGAAEAYGALEQPERTNLRFEALQTVLRKKTPLYIHADDEKALLDIIDFGEKTGLSVTVVGAADSWKVAGKLAENKISVVLAPTQRLPRRPDNAIDQPFRTPAILREAGVLWCFSHSGAWQQRNLPFQAGQAVGYGLDPEHALQALTLHTARILGIDDRYGSLEEGKSATIVVSDGDILDPKSSIVLRAFIDGKEINLDNKQKRLYRKFGKKLDVLK